MSDELKTCPFCGNSAIIVEIGGGAAFRVKCRNILECGAETERFDLKKDVIDAWNRRTMSGQSGAANNTADDNHPLTLEELRRMDGDPVWIEDWWDGFNGWELSADAQDYCAERDTKQYGTLWLAYRRKPEED